MTSADGQTTRRANPRTMRLPGSVAEIAGQPGGSQGRRLLRPRRHPGRRLHRRDHDPGSVAARADGRRRVHRHGAGRSQPSARPVGVRGPHRQGRPHVAGQLARRHRRTRRAALHAEDHRPHLSGDARPGACPHGPRPHRRAQFLGADGSGGTGGALPRHQERAEQQVRDRRQRPDHRRSEDPDHLGSGQGQGRAGLRRRERCRSVEELFLRRRRRGRRADVSGRQSAADQSGGKAGRRCGQTGLAGAAVQQPQRQQPGFATAHRGGCGVDGAHRGRCRWAWAC